MTDCCIHRLFFSCWFSVLTLAGAALAADQPVRAAGRQDPAVFQGPPASMAPDIFGDRQKTESVLRILTVQERVGAARRNELVRVPLFFHAGECSDPDALTIAAVQGDKTPVPYQADDIRRDASGKVARMHVYFYIDLAAWERKQFNLLPGKNPAAKQAALPATESAGKVTLAGNDIQVTFHTQGRLAGAIAGIETKVGKVAIPDQNLAPETKLIRQDDKLKQTRESAINYYTSPEAIHVQELRWASGPLLAKLCLKIAPASAPDDVAEYIYVIPKHGSQIIQTELFHPGEKDSSDTVGAKGNAMLSGKILLGDAQADQQIVAVPAGLRKPLRTVFKYQSKALVNAKSGLSLSMIPYVQAGESFAGQEPDGRVFFCGPQGFQTRGGSNSGTLRVFWGQARFIFSNATTVDDLWALSCKSFQPLTAVVDEPWATPEDFSKFDSQASEFFPKIKNWGRGFDANLAIQYLLRQDDKSLAMLAKQTAPALIGYIPTAEAIAAAAKKSQGAGAIDPWGLTYSRSMLAALAAFAYPNDLLDQQIALTAQASRLVNGRVSDYGWPHVKSFANALNMHIGTYLMGVWGGRKTGNQDLVRWCLDATQNQTILAVFGHGQRPYSLNPGGPDPSDSLYQMTSDFWLRAVELVCNEDLSLHPAIYGHYLDAVDVNADLYQASRTDRPDKAGSWGRATFHRTQSHEHRWESWACGPYLGMLADASDGGRVGLTEACYFIHRYVGKEISYNELGYFFLSEILLRKGVSQYRPAPRPPLPGNLQVKQSGGKNVVTWDAVKGDVAGYRVYRAEQPGGPWTWVNSPYKAMPAFVPPTDAQRPKPQPKPKQPKKGEAVPPPPPPPAPAEPYELKVPSIPDTLVKATSFSDADGKPGAIYFVTAQDKQGRESRWFPNEPLPNSGREAK
jgi:hypothetical protein